MDWKTLHIAIPRLHSTRRHELPNLRKIQPENMLSARACCVHHTKHDSYTKVSGFILHIIYDNDIYITHSSCTIKAVHVYDI